MAFSRYARSPKLSLGTQFGTSIAIQTIRSAMAAGTLSYTIDVLRGAERLDTVAGSVYGDGRYWWVIAAASEIGWGMQVPAGTELRIPDIAAVAKLLG
jgi:hypothetical protein